VCGRYTLATPDPASVRARFPLGESVEIRPRYNAAPGDDVLAVTSDREGEPRGELLRWGLVPAWSKGPGTGPKMINARIETVATRPAFARGFERFRCLIVADGFYEWRSATGTEGASKQAFHITRQDGGMFAFAGLWSAWKGEDGNAPGNGQRKSLRSCTILTTAANSAIAPLHDRMPVILARDAEEDWLDPGTPQTVLWELLAGLSPSQTAVRPVGPAVNDVRCDGPECLRSPEHGWQAALF
jgi:putative SOS response-associated peptidase YedK